MFTESIALFFIIIVTMKTRCLKSDLNCIRWSLRLFSLT